MVLPPRDFESRASTDSAIPARDGCADPGGQLVPAAALIGVAIMDECLPLGKPRLVRAPDRTHNARPMTLDDFDYDLPAELIAQEPAPDRAGSRLLRVDVASGRFQDGLFRDLPGCVRPGDLLVFNDTRVIKARLHGVKDTGGRVEALIERVLDDREALAQVSASHSPRPGSRLTFAEAVVAEVLGREGEFFRLRFVGDTGVLEILERHGELPLPPYIGRTAQAQDERRYQTVYARHAGAVAAPTAGLHFTEGMIADLEAMGVLVRRITLHVGAGTFQPVRVHDLSEHRMHSERFEVSAEVVDTVAQVRAAGGRVIAVGTTSIRALESAAADGNLHACSGETRLFITPGYEFKVVDALLTNFHLPRSTLLMLVSAFGGMETIRRAYAHAIEARYRFFSYGDAMFIDRRGVSA